MSAEAANDGLVERGLFDEGPNRLLVLEPGINIMNER